MALTRKKPYRFRPLLEELESRIAPANDPNLPVPILNSNPGAPVTLYLDFNGHTEPSWSSFTNVDTPPYDIDGNITTYSAQELADINAFWRYVAEDFIPFNVNVTTVEPPSFADGVATRASIGGNGAWYGSPGVVGVALIDAFSNSTRPNIAYVFTAGNTVRYNADTATHETGHVLGLQHQSQFNNAGTKIAEYYTGPGDDTAPVMGDPPSTTRGMWWFGTSSIDSTVLQNDLVVITKPANNIQFRADDYGNTQGTAANLPVNGSGVISGQGIIGNMSDLDVFRFGTLAGTITLTANVPTPYNNLDVRLELRDANFAVVASASPTTSYNATITYTANTGTYYLVVASSGMSANATATNYGFNIGQYSLTGNIVPGNSSSIPGVPGGARPISIYSPLRWIFDPASNTYSGYVSIVNHQDSMSGPFQLTVQLPNASMVIVGAQQSGNLATLLVNGSLAKDVPLQYFVQIRAQPNLNLPTYFVGMAWSLEQDTSAAAAASQAFQLRTQLGLRFSGSYYYNYWGLNEKWMIGNNQWYCVLPNGQVRSWGGTASATMQAANLLATLDSSFFADPGKLWAAQLPGAVNAAPTLAAIADQTIHSGPLTISLQAGDADGSTLSFQAFAAAIPSQAYQLMQQLGLSYAGSYYHNAWGLNEKWMLGSGSQWYCLLADGQLRRWGGSASATLQAANLVATLDASFYADPARLWHAPSPVAPNATFAFQGQQLIVTPPRGFLGSFSVDVVVSDGIAFTTRTFIVTVINNAPTLAAIANQTMSPNSNVLTISLPAADADGDLLSFQAQAAAVPSQAYQLMQQLGLSYAGSYYHNYWGLNEKWMLGGGSQWYCLLADGQLRRWGGSASATMQAANLVATLDASFYADPARLWHASPPVVPNVTFAFQGQQLIITTPRDYLGSFKVEVVASDGLAATTQSFVVTVANNAPILATIANQTIAAGSSGLALTLSAYDVDGGLLSFQAQAGAVASQAYQLMQQLGLSYAGSYYHNAWGLNEKWMLGSGNQWYCLLADGQLRRWGGSASATMQAANLIATLDASFYADPAKLWQATAPASPNVSLTMIGNLLIIQRLNGYVGTIQVTVTVSDGRMSTTQTFLVTLR